MKDRLRRELAYSHNKRVLIIPDAAVVGNEKRLLVSVRSARLIGYPILMLMSPNTYHLNHCDTYSLLITSGATATFSNIINNPDEQRAQTLALVVCTMMS